MLDTTLFHLYTYLNFEHILPKHFNLRELKTSMHQLTMSLLWAYLHTMFLKKVSQ